MQAVRPMARTGSRRVVIVRSSGVSEGDAITRRRGRLQAAREYAVLMTQPPSPSWQPSRIDIGRRRALVGLSGILAAAMGRFDSLGSFGAERAWAQSLRSCVLTPEAGEGPFYLDP